MDKSTIYKLIKTYTFNKSKKKTIIFIHGLFGNSGFWLPFLTFFNQFKILVLDINYPELFKHDLKKINIKKHCESILKNDEEYTLISHSIGSIISQFFCSDKIKTSHEICPVYNVERINNEVFVNQIKARVDLSAIEINKILIDSINFINDNSISENMHINKIQYFPLKDQFFIYKNNFDKRKQFVGNHFDINNSILMIMTDLITNQQS